ncbi:MAG: preprotein translocase subunit SecE [Bifidobacteriaceae bacterium]|nr:preprotein translocase subunit SecE [Bifidobacteriaceae bacterium]
MLGKKQIKKSTKQESDSVKLKTKAVIKKNNTVKGDKTDIKTIKSIKNNKKQFNFFISLWIFLKKVARGFKSLAKIIKKFTIEVVAELKRVVYPTKAELVENSIVVLVFVTIMMVFITVIDFGIGQGVMAIFTK